MKTQNPLQRIFHYQNKPFRTVQIDGEPWFVAADVCDTLGLTQVSRAMNRLDEDEVRLLKVTHPQNPEKSMFMNAVNEPGLYRLIWCSTKPEAKFFRRWITHEVLPALRRTGGYQQGEELPVQSGKLLQFSRRDLLHLAVEAENECEELRGVVAELLPKAEFYDRVADVNASFSLGETAKMLAINGFGRNNLIRFLRSQGVLMADNVAKQRFVERGYFRVVQRDYSAPDGTLRVKAVTRVYEKGVDYIRRLMDSGHGRSAPERGEGRMQDVMERRNAGY